MESTLQPAPDLQNSAYSITEADHVLHLAVTMAGAVSAGSYTAGVMDYLLEALEVWEKAKQTQDDSIPQHQVRIELLNGTSAGGMTAVLTAAALHNAIPPVTPGPDQQANALKNKLYRSWVELTGDNNMLPLMLTNEDIQDNIVPSLLNSTFIEKIAKQMVEPMDTPPTSRPYITPNLEVMVTLTNLQGIRYNTLFGPNFRDAFVATNHLDFGHFVFTDKTGDTTGRIPVSLKNEADCELLRHCAMATGAFPLGLAPRNVSRALQYIRLNPNINLIGDAFNPLNFTDPYLSLNVDGGVLNNEPFDKAEAIFKGTFGKGKTDAERKHCNYFQYSILMIDPFPSVDFKEKKLDVTDINELTDIARSFTSDTETLNAMIEQLKLFEVNNRILFSNQVENLVQLLVRIEPDTGRQEAFRRRLTQWNNKTEDQSKTPNLKKLVMAIVRTVRNQLLFKKEDINQAFDNTDYSRFMIVPKRYSDNGKTNISGSKAIACGSFGGFGGFASKDFRTHDFYLGRLNCKRFLLKHFGVPKAALEANPIFKGMYSPEAIAKFSYPDPERLDTNGKPLEMVPIIPLVDVVSNNALPENPLPWPNLAEQEIYDLRSAFKKRARAVLSGLFNPKSLLWKPLVSLGVWVFDGKVADTIIEMVIDDFREHQLLEPTKDVSKDTGYP